jgi:radical SAM protein (TIGR04043 family)
MPNAKLDEPRNHQGDVFAELQSLGVQLDEGPHGAAIRKGGAGPSDHMALSIGDTTLMVPVLSRGARSSPFRLRLVGSDGGHVVVERDARVVAEGTTRGTARFYALSTKDGIPYHKIALLHSTNVLASTVLQTCYRFNDPSTACQFCALGDSLRGGRTLARKTPEQLAEVAAAALRLDAVEHVVLTTGTPSTPDRGAAHLAACARAIKTATGLPIQVQCEPPDDFTWFERMHSAGADALGLHLEAVEPEVRARVIPSKSEVPVSFYFDAFAESVKVFGRGNVSTYLIAGLGDSHETLVETAERLVRVGVYPFVVPFVPLQGTPMQSHPAPSTEFMQSVYRAVGRAIHAAGLSAAETRAGCAKCGACSSLSAYEKQEPLHA